MKSSRILQTSTGKVGEHLGVLGKWLIWKHHPIGTILSSAGLNNNANWLTKRFFFAAYRLISVFLAVYWLSSMFLAVYWLQLYPIDTLSEGYTIGKYNK